MTSPISFTILIRYSRLATSPKLAVFKEGRAADPILAPRTKALTTSSPDLIPPVAIIGNLVAFLVSIIERAVGIPQSQSGPSFKPRLKYSIPIQLVPPDPP